MVHAIYTVRLEIEKIEEGRSRRENVDKPVELAAFHTHEEARQFCSELQREHSPVVTGEMELLRQMSSPKQFTAGD